MFTVGMPVDYRGDQYMITDIRILESGKKGYKLNAKDGSQTYAFEEELTPVDSSEKENVQTNLQNNIKNMSLACMPLMNGIMAYWDEVPEAACYNVKLYINDQVISKRINERTELYHTFTGLAAIDGLTKGEIDKTIPRPTLGGCSRHSSSNPSSSGLEYYVKVVAENRLGEMIAQSQKTLCKVREF